jgi:hypothetical protein
MNRTIFAGLAGLAVGLFMGAAPASAQATRTWVSGVGDDANPCSRTAPCKTFAGAISKTANCGEIDALDPGGFGALTITKGITIDGGGGQVASVLVAGTNGFVINDTDPTCTRVIIRNLQFQGLAPGSNAGISGILILNGNVVLEHDKIQNFSVDCVNFQPQVNGLQLTIINSDLVGCVNAGIEVSETVGGTNRVQATITNSTFEQDGIGISAKLSGWVSVHGSTISSNTTGVQAGGGNARLSLDNNVITNNSSADVYATNNGQIGMTANSVTMTTGFGMKHDTGGAIVSFGNNWPQFVSSQNTPTSTAAPE